MESRPNVRVLKMSCPTFSIGMLLSYRVNEFFFSSYFGLTALYKRIFHCQRDPKELS